MSRGKPTSAARSKKAVEAVLNDVVRKFETAHARRAGSILFRMIGDGGGEFYLHSTSAGCELSREPRGGPPHVEVIGDVDRILAILDGRREGRLQFFAGGIRVRGDLYYLSEIAHEMGFIKEPF
jgi:predicted lipid carrier protein YhbT